MDKNESIQVEKIESALDAILPPKLDIEWVNRVFPGVGVSPELCATLTAPGQDLLARRGKRWRPLLMMLVCKALGGDDKTLPLVPLVEISHNASLIHDDIEDNSMERRGQPSIHVRYGVDTAINSGSFLYFLPLVCINDLEMSFQNKVFRLWAEHLRRLHLGQALDIAWHRDETVMPSFEEYILMCGLKTGSLSRLAAMFGVFAAEPPASREIAEILGSVSEKLGVGFQILDDVKNLMGDIAGKQYGDDIVEGKKSLPVLLYTQQYDGDITTVNRCFSAARKNGAGTPEVVELIERMQQSGAIIHAQTLGQRLIHEARAVFAAETICDYRLIPQERELLLNLIDMIG
ncbi:MAG: polyprenyl synthetase family protein [Treponema sp.]|nr:polyprenyl synthetase family protein [Treponema sp.]